MEGGSMGFKAVVFNLILLTVDVKSQTTFNDTKKALQTNVFNHFEFAVSLRPVRNVSDLITVSLDFNIAGLNDFNEQNGFVEISGYLKMEWTATEGPTEAVSFEELVDNSYIWKPPIIMVNSIKKAEEIGWDTNVDVRYNFNTRNCSWQPWIIARAACTPDVKYYPFDKQSCVFKLATWGYSSSEMLLTASPTISFDLFEENGEWEPYESSSSSYIENNVSIVEYKLGMKRRPTFYVINLVAPIILLGILNVFVFILPPASGERIGYSITCFLSYVVLLNTVMAFLPTSAAPLAYLSYYTFVMMIFSAAMSLATIITLRIHFKPKDKPISFSMCRTTVNDNSSKIKPVENTEVQEVNIISLDDDLDETGKEHFEADSVIDDKSARFDGSITNRESIVETKIFDNAKTDKDKSTAAAEIIIETKKLEDVKTFTDTKRIESSKTENDINQTREKVAFYLDIVFFLGFLAGQIFFSVSYLIPIILNV